MVNTLFLQTEVGDLSVASFNDELEKFVSFLDKVLPHLWKDYKLEVQSKLTDKNQAIKKFKTLLRKKQSMIPPEKIVYVDEAGIDNRLYRVYARAPRVQKIYADILDKKRKRYSMIGGWINHKFIAPFTFQGGCNKEVFDCWLKNIMLPELTKGTIIVMDNAAFHKSTTTKEIIENARCYLYYICPLILQTSILTITHKFYYKPELWIKN